MTILFLESLCDSEFGSSVLHTPALLAWVASKGLYLRTFPSLDDFEFVQVEAVLWTIGRWAGKSVTPAQAAAIIAADLKLTECLSDNFYPHWLVGAERELQWRGLLSTAFEAGELVRLDFVTLLPIAAAAKAETVLVTSGNEATNAHNADVKPWEIVDPNDPPPEQTWYTPARYFARQLVKDNTTLITKREILADKVVQSLTGVGIKKRGGEKRFSSSTVLKAFSNVSLG